MPARAGARRAADAMHVVFGHIRDIEVDHVADAVHVDAARGDVGRDQRIDPAVAEAGERPRAGALALAAVHGGDLSAGLLQAPEQSIGAGPGAGEDQGLLHVRSLQQRGQQILLAAFTNRVHDLLDGIDRRRPAGDLDHGRGPGRPADELLDLVRHRGGEEQTLPRRRQGGQDAPHVRQEAHVEHAVRLVENDDLDAVELHVPPAEMVEQPSGRGDEQIRTSLQAPLLRLHADPAVDHGAAHAEVPAVLHGGLANLRGELPRRRDDQRPRASRRLATGEVLQDRQQKGGRLPGPGLRARDQVLPVERGRYDARLDGRGSDVARAVDGAQEFRAQTQLFELHGGAYSDLRTHPGAERCLPLPARRPGRRSRRRIWRREGPGVGTGKPATLSGLPGWRKPARDSGSESRS